MLKAKFDRLIKNAVITDQALDDAIKESERSGSHIEETLMRKGIPKHEILICLSEYYGCPFVEYEEDIMVSRNITMGLDMQKLKSDLWFPLSARNGRAEVIVSDPENRAVADDVKKGLNVDRIKFFLALPSDIVRIIENNQDVNPGFSAEAGRTPLAMVRTFLAERRSLLACIRTSLAKARTGLAFIRTGIAFITVALVLFRLFGIGYLTILEAVLLLAGLFMAVDGFLWYIPARQRGKRIFDCNCTELTWGTSVLTISNILESPSFERSGIVEGATKLRKDWRGLSPVMRRRFLACDRTDLAEERTSLACYRTMMARARTGLAFTRTGIAFIGIGIALLRQFHAGVWTMFDALLIIMGFAMVTEGFYWYFPGRRAGGKGFASVRNVYRKRSIWEIVFPPVHRDPGSEDDSYPHIPVTRSQSPGIWGTTGLALERTLLAERRNVMARLRTVMARSRTGLAFVRTGMSISAVGAGLLVYFGVGLLTWTIFDSVLILSGLALVVDGLYWHIPADKIRRQFPYCFGDMEITLPDYGRPARYWKKVVFNHD
ncbi:MAG TPA: hypothetical protein ENH45_01070 [Nitrospirae bacterium]|nr:hypothetical protein BMS3Abin10_02264 [bacterium BMS3Abin10]GBE38516.1 hypothetical protein BMS3Bbin08_01123 [bacterium BMS3Bbin08]HDH01299.1 hypothetical protein [Nitrospirota bacterium]HDH50484.1 hypothetical protein [Nitrospirota bacterium]HDZ83785.1 hypothetical protein [Nitrospirota bacterium]